MSVNVDRVKACLIYDPETGAFAWKSRPELRPSINKRLAGKPAGYAAAAGYIYIRLDGKLYLAHRLAWLIMTGEWPKELLDHRNRNRIDNRWCNLREADSAQNAANSGMFVSNKSGLKGVFLDKQTGLWRAMISINNKQYHIGRFVDRDYAAAAYVERAQELRGEFAQ